MHRRQLLAASAAAATGIALAVPANAQTTNDESQASLDTVMAFMGAMGGGDMDSMGAPMADAMVWQNECDPDLPWIGTWEGKEAIFGFLGTFSQNVQVIHWENQDVFASGDTVAVFGRMKIAADGLWRGDRRVHLCSAGQGARRTGLAVELVRGNLRREPGLSCNLRTRINPAAEMLRRERCPDFET